MLWIGLTGPMGSGKSTVATVLRELGFTVLDADAVVRTVLGPGGEGEADVLAAFAAVPGVRDGAGHLDRRVLGRAVFGQPARLALLESLIHPRVREEVARLKSGLEKVGAAAAFYDVPLLFEKNMEAGFDHILVISAPIDVRRTRLVARTGLTLPEIEERFNSQLPPEYKEARASAVIVNNGDLEGLRARVAAALRALRIPLPAATDAQG